MNGLKLYQIGKIPFHYVYHFCSHKIYTHLRLESLTQKVDALYDRCNTNRLLMLVLHDRLNSAGVGSPLDGMLVGCDGRSEPGGGWTSSAQDLRLDSQMTKDGFVSNRRRSSLTDVRSAINHSPGRSS